MFENIDKKQKIELIITGIGIIILISLAARYINRPVLKNPSIIIQKLEPVSPFEAAERPAPAMETKWGRDPFSLEAYSDNATQGLTLNGIVWDANNPYAIINNNIVKLGDRVNDMTVIQINEKDVIVDQDGQQFTLDLQGN